MTGGFLVAVPQAIPGRRVNHGHVKEGDQAVSGSVSGPAGPLGVVGADADRHLVAGIRIDLHLNRIAAGSLSSRGNQ